MRAIIVKENARPSKLFVLKDKKSGKYLNNIWLSQDPNDITFYQSLEDAKKQINTIEHGKVV